MSNTFTVGDMTIHRIVEMETGFTPALEFLPGLTPGLLAENRSWLTPAALDAQDNLVLCFQSYIVRTPRHVVLVDAPRARCGTRRRTMPGCAASPHWG